MQTVLDCDTPPKISPEEGEALMKKRRENNCAKPYEKPAEPIGLDMI